MPHASPSSEEPHLRPGATSKVDPHRAAMLDFVRARGGKVRFDEYAAEHLTGKHGFYSSHVDIGVPGSGVPTPCTSNPEYVQLLTAVVIKCLGQYWRANSADLEGRNLTFCEIGGGTGKLKEQLLDAWGSLAKRHRLPQMEYISVDLNQRHLERQGRAGPGRTVRGTATSTTLPDGSLDVLFDEEVLDCLPFRIFHWDSSRQRLTKEAHVAVKGDSLVLEHLEIKDPDRLAGHTEADLARRNYKLPLYRYAPQQWDYIKESVRVLRPGGMRISSDYDCDGLGSLLRADLGDVENALRFPYAVDLTHGVDFVRLAQMAYFNGLRGTPHSTMELFGGISANFASVMSGVNRSIFVGAKSF